MMNPWFAIGSGWPSRNVNGESLSLLFSIECRNVFSSFHNSINEVSRATVSRFPAALGTGISSPTLDAFLNVTNP